MTMAAAVAIRWGLSLKEMSAGVQPDRLGELVIDNTRQAME
jgi:hypothetical protein